MSNVLKISIWLTNLARLCFQAVLLQRVGTLLFLCVPLGFCSSAYSEQVCLATK